jgi:NAD+ synthase
MGEPSRALLATGNLKARLRMVALYYVANLHNYLVVGTSNKAELTVGYFTKYGDGAADLLPLAGLVKRQVRELARELGVPEAVITKAPSAGLWPGQTDESDLGLTYDQLDDLLLTGQGDPRVVAEVELRKRSTQHKRERPPEAPIPDSLNKRC